jgi:drug/metabolite transporter (DMT)-like permease
VLIFSGSLPATRVAVDGFRPGVPDRCARGDRRPAGVGAAAGVSREAAGARRPRFACHRVALGVVVGFPLLTALALKHVTAAHSIVFIGLLPLATAIFGVWRGGERPRPAFWLFSCLGSALVAGFALSQGVISASPVGDLLMLAAIIACGLGYAEGAKLSRRLGGWQVISWALVLSLPVMLAVDPHYPASVVRGCR